jgi:hypothetical protein
MNKNFSSLKWILFLFILLISGVIWIFISFSSSNNLEFSIPTTLLKKKIYLYPSIPFEFFLLPDSTKIQSEIEKQEKIMESNWIYFYDNKRMEINIDAGLLNFEIMSIEEIKTISSDNEMVNATNHLMDYSEIAGYNISDYSEHKKYLAKIKFLNSNKSSLKTNVNYKSSVQDSVPPYLEIYNVSTKSNSNVFVFKLIMNEMSFGDPLYPSGILVQKRYDFIDKNNYMNFLKEFIKKNKRKWDKK